MDVARRLKAQQGKSDDPGDPVEQLDFEFVLFSSALIDYDYIMQLLARSSGQTPEKQKLSREQLIRLIQSDAKFIDERDDIAEYIHSLEMDKPLSEAEIRAGYEAFKRHKAERELRAIAEKHRLDTDALARFVETTLARRVFDGDALSDLFAPLALGWKERAHRELALVQDLLPLLRKGAGGREISGLGAYL